MQECSDDMTVIKAAFIRALLKSDTRFNCEVMEMVDAHGSEIY